MRFLYPNLWLSKRCHCRFFLIIPHIDGLVWDCSSCSLALADRYIAAEFRVDVRACVYLHMHRFLYYDDVIMGAMASQIISPTIVYSTVYSYTDQRIHHLGPVISPHKWPITREMFPFDDVIIYIWYMCMHVCMRGYMHGTNVYLYIFKECMYVCIYTLLFIYAYIYTVIVLRYAHKYAYIYTRLFLTYAPIGIRVIRMIF